MNKCRLVSTFAYILLLILLTACNGSPSVAPKPPAENFDGQVPSYPNAQKIAVSESESAFFIKAIFGLYSSSTNISWTKDTGTKVKEKLDKLLSDSNWRPVSNWSEYGRFYASVWRKDNLQVVVAYFDNLSDDQISEFDWRYGISVSETGTTLIVTHLWDTTQLIPSTTPVDIPTPSATLVPSFTSTPHPTNTPLPTSTSTSTPMPTSTPTPHPDLVSFVAADNSAVLNPLLGWQQGGSNASGYDLSLHADALTLITGPYTEQWRDFDTAPLVLYPVSGNFEAQVQVTINPVKLWQSAALGIRSSDSHARWVRLQLGSNDLDGYARYIVATAHQPDNSFILNYDRYPNETVYLRIERRGALFTMSYSNYGANWVTIKKDYVFGMSDEVEVFLSVMSYCEQGITAQFRSFIVSKK